MATRGGAAVKAGNKKRISFEGDSDGDGRETPTDPADPPEMYLPPLPPLSNTERPPPYPGAGQGRPTRKSTANRRGSSDLESSVAIEANVEDRFGEARHAGGASAESEEEKGLFDEYRGRYPPNHHAWAPGPSPCASHRPHRPSC